MKTIEITKEDKSFVDKLYKSDRVIFEHTLLRSDCLNYSLCYVAKDKLFDIVIENFLLGKLVYADTRHHISNTTKKYFYLYKDDVYEDFHKTTFKCLSHALTYME